MTARPMLSFVRKRPTGSGAADLLVISLVFLILCIAASPFYRAAKSEAAKLRCESYRNLLLDAQSRHRTQSPDGSYARHPSDLAGQIRVPSCPSGGRYRFRLSDLRDRDERGQAVGEGRLVVVCSSRDHSPVYSGRLSERESKP